MEKISHLSNNKQISIFLKQAKRNHRAQMEKIIKVRKISFNLKIQVLFSWTMNNGEKKFKNKRKSRKNYHSKRFINSVLMLSIRNLKEFEVKDIKTNLIIMKILLLMSSNRISKYKDKVKLPKKKKKDKNLTLQTMLKLKFMRINIFLQKKATIQVKSKSKYFQKSKQGEIQKKVKKFQTRKENHLTENDKDNFFLIIK